MQERAWQGSGKGQHFSMGQVCLNASWQAQTQHDYSLLVYTHVWKTFFLHFAIDKWYIMRKQATFLMKYWTLGMMVICFVGLASSLCILSAYSAQLNYTLVNEFTLFCYSVPRVGNAVYMTHCLKWCYVCLRSRHIFPRYQVLSHCTQNGQRGVNIHSTRLWCKCVHLGNSRLKNWDFLNGLRGPGQTRFAGTK